MNKLPLAQIALLCCAMADAGAQEPVSFTDTSISALSGDHFRLDPAEQSTFTLEQAHSGAWGDTYWFIDSTHYDHGSSNGERSTWYGELSARASLSKLGTGSLSVGPLKDVLVATTYERGEHRNVAEAILVGIGTDWDLPDFAYFQANAYARKELYAGGWDSWQITLSGAHPFHIGSQKFVVDGFLDYVAQGGVQHENLHFVPQVKWDLGNFTGHRAGRVWVGIEFDWWRNKYGIADKRQLHTNQSAVSILLRWHL